MDVARPARPDPNRRYAVSTKGAPVKGSPDAPLVIVEFSDFQCPFCSRVTPTLRQIEREYGEKIRIVFKHLPLTMHPKAPGAHAAAEAAHRQGRFWEMHDRIFANQREMSEEKYIEYAEQIGLDLEQFEADVASADSSASASAHPSRPGIRTPLRAALRPAHPGVNGLPRHTASATPRASLRLGRTQRISPIPSSASRFA